VNIARVTLILTLLAPIVLPVPVRAAATLELYGTFHAMGIIVTIATSDDPDGDATAMLAYRVSGSGAYRQGFPLSRVADTRFVGSLFWLEPGTAYDVRVTFNDPDGLLHGVTVEATGSTRAEIAIPAPSKSYYVSPTGSGTACTLATPCVLVEGLSQAQPGEEVVLREGIYYQDEITLPRSGTSGAPIVIRGYAGETAILDGADPATFTWTAQGGGVYRTTIHTDGTHLVMADGQRLFPYDNLTDLQNLSRDNTPGFYADSTTLYVHLAGDADPNAVTMVVSRYGSAFYVTRNYIYFLDLTFRHYGQGGYPKAVYFYGASDNLVQGCTFASNDIGIGIKYGSHHNVIQDNEFYDTIFDWPWEDIKELGGIEDGGIVFYNPVTGRGNVIRRNTFHDDFDGFGVCPSNTAAMTNETDIYENLIYNMGDDGLETDGQCSNVRIWGNTFHDVLMGISLAPVYTGPVYAIRNLIYRTGVGNNDYTGSPFKFNSGYDQSGPMCLFHNTCDAALPGNNGLYVKAPGTWEIIYARNNIWSGTDYAVENYNTGQPIDLDYDDLWNDNGGDLVRWNSTRYATLAAFTAATGQEPHGLSVEPAFVAATNGDYALDPGSDLIDAGVVIPGINDDYVGAAPDVGAYEYGTAIPSAVTDLRVTHAVTGTGVLTATLRWIAPANAVTYTLRYSDTLISENNWAGVLTVAVPFTATPGSTEWLTAPVAYSGSTVYFALKSQNVGGDWSALSNNAFWPHHDVWLPLITRAYGP
jgi:parallel beta-helix repeat protein